MQSSELKTSILEVLVAEALGRRKITYGVLGAKIGHPSRGPWKLILDEIGREEKAIGRPDITYLVVSAETGFPSQIDFKPAKPPSTAQNALAEKVWAQIWAYYPPTENSKAVTP